MGSNPIPYHVSFCGTYSGYSKQLLIFSSNHRLIESLSYICMAVLVHMKGECTQIIETKFISIYMLDTRNRKVPYDFCKTFTTGDICLIHIHITPPLIYEYIKGGVANLSLLKISF